jgi:hypothetical protein
VATLCEQINLLRKCAVELPRSYPDSLAAELSAPDSLRTPPIWRARRRGPWGLPSPSCWIWAAATHFRTRFERCWAPSPAMFPGACSHNGSRMAPRVWVETPFLATVESSSGVRGTRVVSLNSGGALLSFCERNTCPCPDHVPTVERGKAARVSGPAAFGDEHRFQKLTAPPHAERIASRAPDRPAVSLFRSENALVRVPSDAWLAPREPDVSLALLGAPGFAQLRPAHSQPGRTIRSPERGGNHVLEAQEGDWRIEIASLRLKKPIGGYKSRL